MRAAVANVVRETTEDGRSVHLYLLLMSSWLQFSACASHESCTLSRTAIMPKLGAWVVAMVSMPAAFGFGTCGSFSNRPGAEAEHESFDGYGNEAVDARDELAGDDLEQTDDKGLPSCERAGL